MFGIDGIIIILVVAAVTLGSISWILGRAEQRRYEEVMRTAEREAAHAAALAGDSDRPAPVPRATDPGAGYVSPMPRVPSHARSASAQADAPPRA